MGIFDFNLGSEEKEEKLPADIKQEEVRKMSGFSGISDVAKAAPSSYSETAPSQTRVRSAAPASAKQAKLSKADAAAAAKEERKRKALETVGKRYCKLIAEIPYDMWAKFAEDKMLALNEAEAKELADSYYELAQAIEPDFSNPWIIGFGICIQNGMLITSRYKYLSDLEEEAKKDKDESKLPPEPQQDDDRRGAK